MPRRNYRGRDALISAVVARARQIRATQYKFKIPKQNEDDNLVAEYVASMARKVGLFRKRGYGPVNENWIKKISVPDLCRWAMHPHVDIWEDLLEIEEFTESSGRECLPGVHPHQVEDRKELIGWVLDGYAEHLMDLKRKRGRTR